MRIRILNPHWEKNRSGSGSKLFQISNKFFPQRRIFQFCLIFSLIFMLKLDERFRNQEIFYNFSFCNSSDLGFESKFFFLAVNGWYFAPWIRIQESKILRIQRIRILSTKGNNIFFSRNWLLCVNSGDRWNNPLTEEEVEEEITMGEIQDLTVGTIGVREDQWEDEEVEEWEILVC